MPSFIKQIVESLKQDKIEPDQFAIIVRLCEAIPGFGDEELEDLLASIVSNLESFSEAGCDIPLEEVFRCIAQRSKPGQTAELNASHIDLLLQIYSRIPPESNVRNQILACLTTDASAESLNAFVGLVANDPPLYEQGIVLAFGPLFKHDDLQLSCLFPKLLDAMSHQHLAAPVLDVANHFSRGNGLSHHPAATRCTQLTELLGQLVGSLAQIEEGKFHPDHDAKQISQTINRSVSLIVSLCDTLGLIGRDESIGKLNQALSLKHRRIRTEAAAALAQLDDETGRNELVALAAEPVARKRVLAYANELGLTDRIDEQFQTDQAIAESELALWLANPNQMGLPPSSLELLDFREQYWPSYKDPIKCFLFRFVYRAENSEFSGIAIVGPMTYSFSVELDHLTNDELYALFAGWQADHQDIYEVNIDQLSPRLQASYSKLKSQLDEHGLINVQCAFLGRCFEETFLVASAERNGELGTIAQTEAESLWIPAGQVTGNGPPLLTPDLAYCVVKGKRLLSSFN